ncbi:hypothetical protein GUITHDRAFT_77375, partial [Guillardia theta CCMP2712]
MVASNQDEEREVTECPKKPMNAFLLWFLDPSNTMKQRHPGLKHAELMSVASEHWKSMKEIEKGVYKKKYSQLMDQWNRDVAAYKKYCAAHGIRPKFQVSADAQEKKRDCAGDDDDAGTKKSISAYWLWSHQAREEIRKENPKMPMKEVMQRMGERWKKITPEEKHEWEDKARSENEKQKKKQSSAKKREP